MDRCMDQNSIWPLRLEALDSFFTAMRGTVVHYPENAPSRLVRFLIHDISDEAIDRSDAVLDLATTKEPPVMHVPCRQVRPGSASPVLVLDSHRAAGCWRQRRMFALPRLNTGFLVGGNDEFSRSQFLAVPNPLIQVQDSPCLFGELRVTRENPTAVTPWLQCVSTQPAPQCCATHFGNDSLCNHFSPDVGHRESRQRQTQAVRKFTCQSLHLDHDAGGKSGLNARRAAVPQGPPASRGRIAFAICSRSAEEYRGVMQ